MLWLGKNHKQIMPISTTKLVLLLIALGALAASALLHPSEVETLKAIAEEMNVTTWDFRKDPCSGEGNWGYYNLLSGISSQIHCVCKEIHNTSTCRVTKIKLTGLNLNGRIPAELSKLRKLEVLDLRRNCLTGPLPPQLAHLNLVAINVLGNKLSGPFPLVLTKISTLEILFIEANNFSGPIPSDIRRLINLRTLALSSNGFEGNFPSQVFTLINLVTLSMSDTNFTGQIPDKFHKLKNLRRLVIEGTYLEGPIPSSISSLNLTDLRITDLKGNMSSAFPNLSSMKSLRRFIMRNCMLIGNIPEYIGNMAKLADLDLSFNNLSGEIPASLSNLKVVHNMYLTGNMLTGPLPQWIRLNQRMNLDISKNYFTWNGSDIISCLVNAAESYSSAANNISQVKSYMKQGSPCTSQPYYHSVHINCGGNDIPSVGEESTYTYDSDSDPRGASMYYSGQSWAFSSTGNFLDDDFVEDTYIKVNTSALTMTDDSYPEELYTTARVSPLSLTYYGLCLLNGKYIVKLHFAEIIFSNGNNSYTSLGRRVFDIFIQGKLVHKDFDIAQQAGGAAIPLQWLSMSQLQK